MLWTHEKSVYKHLSLPARHRIRSDSFSIPALLNWNLSKWLSISRLHSARSTISLQTMEPQRGENSPHWVLRIKPKSHWAIFLQSNVWAEAFRDIKTNTRTRATCQNFPGNNDGGGCQLGFVFLCYVFNYILLQATLISKFMIVM